MKGLLGNIGGIVGICLGFCVAQTPNMIRKLFFLMNSYFLDVEMEYDNKKLKRKSY